MAVRERSAESTESMFLLLLKCIIVSSLSEKEREHRGFSSGSGGGHMVLLNCRTGADFLCCYQTVTKPNRDTQSVETVHSAGRSHSTVCFFMFLPVSV